MMVHRSQKTTNLVGIFAGAVGLTLGGAVLLLVSLAGYVLVVALLLALFVFAALAMIAGVSVTLVRRWITPAKAKSSVAASAAWIRRVDIFKDLSASQVQRIAALGQMVSIPSGQLLGKAGEPGHAIFVIVEGQAELTAPSRMGEVTVRIAEPGESLPLAALLGNGSLITTITAMTDMRVLTIPVASLLDLCARSPDIGSRLYATMSEILAGRYKAALAHFTGAAQRAAEAAELWANV